MVMSEMHTAPTGKIHRMSDFLSCSVGRQAPKKPRFWMVMGISGLYIGWIYGAGAGWNEGMLFAGLGPADSELLHCQWRCDSRPVEDFPCGSRTSCMAPRLFGRRGHVMKRG